jgi:hypothetical protein
MFDLAALRHLLEQGLAAIALQQFASKTDKGPMDVAGRKRRRDTVDMRSRHQVRRFARDDLYDPAVERRERHP